MDESHRVLRVRSRGDDGRLIVPRPEGYLETTFVLQDHYNVVFEHKFAPNVGQERIPRLGIREPRRCRMCPLEAKPGTFKKKAHVIPQGLGNRALITWEECDICNGGLGSNLEDDLLKYMALIRAI